MEPNKDAQNGAFTIFHLFGLLLGLAGVAVAIKAGWDTGGATGFIAGVLTAVVLAPIGLAVGFAGSLVALMMLVFVGNHRPPSGGGVWTARVHKALRGLVIVACLASLAYNVPRALEAPTWSAWTDETKLGVFLPICTIIFLQISRFEASSVVGNPEA